jgi:hypothetical protein
MKKNNYLVSLMFVLFATFLYSCEQLQTDEPAKPVDVEFVLNNPTQTDPGAAAKLMSTVTNDNMLTNTNMLKNGNVNDVPICSDGIPTYIHIVGTGPDGAINDTLKLLQNFEDGKQTVLVKVLPGDYTIEQFEVLDENGENLWVSPQENSTYANLFNFQNSVVINFTIEPFTKNKVDVDVLCWKNYAYKEFGYVWFDYHDYEIHTLCFFGDVCTKFYDSWSTEPNSPYANVQIDGYDFPALFNVTVINDNDNTQVTTATNVAYTDDSGNVAYGGPVCVEYLDNKEIENETYTAQLSLVLPDGTEVLLDEISFTDADYSDNGTNLEDVSDWGGVDGIWEFAVGDCAMAAQQDDIDAVYNVPWMPLPTEVTFKLVNTRPNSYFALGNIQPDVEVGEFVTGDTLSAWCGNEIQHITWNHTYKAHVYPYYNVPSSAPQVYQDITSEQWAKLNWIVNEVVNNVNLSNYNYMEIQNAIWHILGYTGTTGGDSTKIQEIETNAAMHTNYIPPLGGYVVVLVDPYVDITGNTEVVDFYQLAIIRFDP